MITQNNIVPAPSPAPELAVRSARLRRGEHLFHMHDPAHDTLFYIRSGDIKLYQLSQDGSQRIIDFLYQGSWIGVDAIGCREQHACALALTDSQVDAVPYHQLAALLESQPQHADDFSHMLSQEIARQQATANMLRCATAAQRLALFLLRRAIPGPGPDEVHAPLPMSRQDIGDYLGMSPSTVSRVLNAFRRDSLIALRRRSAYLLSPERLEAIATAGESGNDLLAREGGQLPPPPAYALCHEESLVA